MARDEVNQHEEAYVGDVVRLEIPLKSVTNLRRVASWPRQNSINI